MPFDNEIATEDQDRLLVQRARDRLAAGWSQGSFYDPANDGVCMLGALICAVQNTHIPDLGLNDPDAPVFDRLVNKLSFASIGHLIRFNGCPTRTKNEVLDRFDACLMGMATDDTAYRGQRPSGPDCNCTMCKQLEEIDSIITAGIRLGSDGTAALGKVVSFKAGDPDYTNVVSLAEFKALKGRAR